MKETVEDCDCRRIRECKVCQRKYNQQWYQENKTVQQARVLANSARYKLENEIYVRELKSKNPCTDCSDYFHWFAMDFDHVRGKKIRNLSLMIHNFPLERIKEEIAKCDLVCATCHRLRTAARMNLAPVA